MIPLQRARLKRDGGRLLASRFDVVHRPQDRVLGPHGVDNAAVYDLFREDGVGPVPQRQDAERQRSLCSFDEGKGMGGGGGVMTRKGCSWGTLSIVGLSISEVVTVRKSMLMKRRDIE